ncbi:protein kinase domain-containing protein [Acinetobacter haemolyticus]|uniref:protein kinase domain-containing protein n=1 Tax=Acinetobacter haemolyticus TaxID=29430 RepID=UPI000F744B85|nr:protein kinase [Acinetobacter haemolyticus]NAS07606.1 protein kinase [Acinetobacter haemolyticus]RSN78959.1 protein kinase [Acinetobacter haemolyticus]
MSSTTWIFDSNIQLDELKLRTKSQSYAYGRRLYTFQIGADTYWLKFHLANTDQTLQAAFQHELGFYQSCSTNRASFLIDHQIIALGQQPPVLRDLGEGNALIVLDSAPFFSDLTTFKTLGEIKQKIHHALNSLGELHQMGWIHGDLKVEHFRLYKNTCRLIDFEQSLQLHHETHNLNATPHYMAPELFHGKNKSVQSDLYALGIILYEWLTQTKLRANSYHDWAVLHCQQLQLQVPKQLEPFLPLLKGLTQKHSEQRLCSVLDAQVLLNDINLL